MKNIMPPINTPDNAFHDGNPATGEQGTIVPGLWLNNVQRGVISIQQELLSVLTKAGIEIDETKQDQLVTAITKLITQGIPELPSASLAQKGIVQLSSATNSDSETLAATSKAVKTANDAALKIVNNLSEIAAAGPGAVLAAITNLNLLTTVNNANGALQAARNLSDLNDTAAARTNLGLGGASSLNVGTTAGTVAAGNDSRIVGALQSNSNLSDVPNKPAARGNLGLGNSSVLNTANNAEMAAGSSTIWGQFGYRKLLYVKAVF
ncbi:phage tail protein [Yersinia pseudotuberculosis]|uniref:phage tail protein n=1 Tax=Yersinia pseudotuberculosis TaxID=633 RepID=UPI0038B5853C